MIIRKCLSAIGAIAAMTSITVAQVNSGNSVLGGPNIVDFIGRKGRVRILSGDLPRVPANVLPAPTASTVGGVKALAESAHCYTYQIGIHGTPMCAQPVSADILNNLGGTGSVNRSQAAINAMHPTVLDKGADPFGVADSAAAFTNIIGQFQESWVPHGTYYLSSNVTVPNTYILHLDFGATIVGPGRIINLGRMEDWSSGALTGDARPAIGLGPHRILLPGGVTPEQVVEEIPSSANGQANFVNGTAFFVNNVGNGGALFGAAHQNASTSGFPAGVTGYGNLSFAGNAVFGVFGRADCMTAGGCTNEFNAFNFSGVDPANSWPPNFSFGSTNTNAVPVVAACGGNNKCQAGIMVSVEGSVPNQSLAGLYTWPNAVSNYGIFVDASAIQGPNRGALIRVPGAAGNVALTLQPMTYGASNTVFQILAPGGFAEMLITNDGSITSNSDHITLNSQATPTPISGGACTQGTIKYDANKIYICVSTNTWKYAALSTL